MFIDSCPTPGETPASAPLPSTEPVDDEVKMPDWDCTGDTALCYLRIELEANDIDETAPMNYDSTHVLGRMACDGGPRRPGQPVRFECGRSDCNGYVAAYVGYHLVQKIPGAKNNDPDDHREKPRIPEAFASVQSSNDAAND